MSNPAGTADYTEWAREHGVKVPFSVSHPKPASESLFYIQDTRCVVGNSASWWRPDGNGYTCNLDEAWKVPGTWSGRDTNVLRPCAGVDKLSERHFDVQKLGRL